MPQPDRMRDRLERELQDRLLRSRLLKVEIDALRSELERHSAADGAAPREPAGGKEREP